MQNIPRRKSAIIFTSSFSFLCPLNHFAFGGVDLGKFMTRFKETFCLPWSTSWTADTRKWTCHTPSHKSRVRTIQKSPIGVPPIDILQTEFSTSSRANFPSVSIICWLYRVVISSLYASTESRGYVKSHRNASKMFLDAGFHWMAVARISENLAASFQFFPEMEAGVQIQSMGPPCIGECGGTALQ